MCDKCDWEQYKEKTETLMERTRNGTSEFLESILNFILDANHITEAQRERVDEIENERS